LTIFDSLEMGDINNVVIIWEDTCTFSYYIWEARYEVLT
jgi:hypothetical protein